MIRETLCSRSETYTDGSYHCRLHNPDNPIQSCRAVVTRKGRIQWSDDWALLGLWEAQRLIPRVISQGPATYGAVDYYVSA